MSRFVFLALSIALCVSCVSASESTFQIKGDVNSPGTHKASLEANIALTDALVIADLKTSASTTRAFLVRTLHEKSEPVVIVVDPREAQARAKRNPLLQPGDRLLFVAKTDRLATEPISKTLASAVLKRVDQVSQP